MQILHSVLLGNIPVINLFAAFEAVSAMLILYENNVYSVSHMTLYQIYTNITWPCLTHGQFLGLVKHGKVEM